MVTKNNNPYLSDEELVAQIVKTKNTILFGELYDRFSHLVYNKCHNFVKSDAEAKDLAQDIFLKLYIKLKSFKGNSKFSTWLYAFTYNHCVNHITRDRERKIEKYSIPVEQYDHLLIETDDYNLFQLQVGKLRKALEIIPPDDKMLLLLKYQDDLSIKDIMVVLEIGESAVKMRLKRAKARVIELCNEKLYIMENPFKKLVDPPKQVPEDLKKKVMEDVSAFQLFMDAARLFSFNYASAAESFFKKRNKNSNNKNNLK